MISPVQPLEPGNADFGLQEPTSIDLIKGKVSRLAIELGWEQRRIPYENGRPQSPRRTHLATHWERLENSSIGRALSSLMDKVDRIAVLRLFGIFVRAVLFRGPRLLIDAIFDRVQKWTLWMSRRQLHELRERGVILPLEQLELETVLPHENAFALRMDAVINRLSAEGKVDLGCVERLRDLNQKKRPYAVLVRLQNAGQRIGLIDGIQRRSGRDRHELMLFLKVIQRSYPHLALDETVKEALNRLQSDGWGVLSSLKSVLKLLSEDVRLSRTDRATFEWIHGRTSLNLQRGEIAEYLRAYRFYRQKFLELRELTSALVQLRSELQQADRSVVAESISRWESLQKELENLYLGHGLIMQAAERDPMLPKHGSYVIGDFHQEWRFINDLLNHVDAGIFTRQERNLLSGDAFTSSEKGFWPVNNGVLDLLQGRPLSSYPVEGEKLSITRPHPLQDESDPIRSKPLVAGFFINIGSGHRSGLRGVAQSLPDCNVQAVDSYGELFKQHDVLRNLDRDLGVEGLANNLAQHEDNHLLNLATYIPDDLLMLKRPQLERLVEEYVERERPDILISNFPALNPVFLNVAKKFDIPFLVVTTDIEIRNFLRGMSHFHCDLDYPKYEVSVPYDAEGCSEGVGEIHPSLRSHLVFNYGYPLRRTFSEEVSDDRLNQLRQQYGIQPNENVVLIMMGGNAAQAASDYADLLTLMAEEELNLMTEGCEDKPNVRFICLCGDLSKPANANFRDSLNALNHRGNRRVTIHATGATPHIAELMSLPELKALVSKPGGASTNEAIKKRVPILFHVGGTVIAWEQYNMDYAFRKRYGRVLQMSQSRSNRTTEKRRELARKLGELFYTRDQMLSGELPVPESEINFTANLRDSIRRLLTR